MKQNHLNWWTPGIECSLEPLDKSEQLWSCLYDLSALLPGNMKPLVFMLPSSGRRYVFGPKYLSTAVKPHNDVLLWNCWSFMAISFHNSSVKTLPSYQISLWNWILTIWLEHILVCANTTFCTCSNKCWTSEIRKHVFIWTISSLPQINGQKNLFSFLLCSISGKEGVFRALKSDLGNALLCSMPVCAEYLAQCNRLTGAVVCRHHTRRILSMLPAASSVLSALTAMSVISAEAPRSVASRRPSIALHILTRRSSAPCTENSITFVNFMAFPLQAGERYERHKEDNDDRQLHLM